MSSTPRRAPVMRPRRRRRFASVAAFTLVAGAVQLLPSAGADEVVIRQVSSAADSGVVDANRDGVADSAGYGVTNAALSVGEQPRDGSDLRLLLPFAVSDAALEAAKGGGTANISMRVWRVDNLTNRNLVFEAFTGGVRIVRADYSRRATTLVTLAPVEGRLAVDVTKQVRSMPAAGTLTLRLRLDRPAPRGGGPLTQVNIATNEARNRVDQPVLSVSSSGSPNPTIPPTAPPTSTPPIPPTSTPTTPPTAPPPIPPTSPPASGTSQPPALVTGGQTWMTTFSDDFSGTSVDTGRWNVQDNSNFGSGNHEDHCYKAANTTVAGGTLRMTGKRETVTGCGSNPDGGDTYYFTSGMVTTRQQGGSLRFKYRHGYTEVRMRVPRGNIYWPAFWLVGAGDGSSPGWPAYGEFDVAEIYGSKPDISESNFHRTGGNIGARNHNVTTKGSGGGVDINPPNPFVAGGTNDWHVYGLNWTADRLEWYIDGVLVRAHEASGSAELAALGYEHSIILNLAMGGNGPRYPDHGYTGIETAGGYSNGNLVADLPGTMEVDYVKVWQP